MQGLLRHTRLSRQVNYQVIGKRSVTIVRLRCRRKVTKRNLDLIGTSHEGCLEGVRFITLSVTDYAGVNAVSRPYIITKSGVEFCQDSKHIHVRHNRLDIVVCCQTGDSRCCTYGVTTCVDLYHCQVAERYITLDSRIACCYVLCDQTTRHPEAYRAIVSYTVVNTGTLCGVVACDLTTVQRERTVIDDCSTVAAVITTLDLCTTYVVGDCERTIINDHASVCLRACEVTIQAKAVQIEHYRLTCRYDQCTVCAFCRQTLAQLQDTTVRHSSIQICPSSDSTAYLVHIGLSDITVDTRDLTVCIRRHVQYLVAQTCLCRQVNIQIIRVRSVTVIDLLSLRKVAERNLDCICTSHEGCLERVRLGTLCIGDHTRCFTVTCPYVIAQSSVEFSKDSKHIHVRHNRLDIVVCCQTGDSRCCTYGVTTCVDLYHCQVAERYITLDSRIACCYVLCDQTTRHPEAYRAIVSYTVVNTGTLCGVVACDLTTVQRERTVIDDCSTVAAVITTLDLCTTYVVGDCERTIINDHASVCLRACEVTIQAKAVQIEHYRLTCRYDQCTVCAFCRQTLAQLQDTTVRHSSIQICPSSDSTAYLVHIGLSDITVDTRDLTVCIRRHVQYLVAQTCLCRQVNIQIIRVRSVTVIDLLSLRKVAERNLDCICTSHEGCLERVRLGALCIGDHTCCFTITCPYIVAESVVQLLQDLVDGRCRNCRSSGYQTDRMTEVNAATVHF